MALEMHDAGPEDASIIHEGSFVILRKDRIIKPCRIERGKKVKLDRSSFLLDPLIGHPFGSQFEWRKGRITKIFEEDKETFKGGSSLAGFDNRHLKDDAGKSQKLSQEHIKNMQTGGLSGKDIVDKVIENSSSFTEKTEYSQQKYINKKQKKHIQIVTVVKSSTALVCEMYAAKGPSKVLHLRIDSLARMLTLANVHANSRVLVVETTQGLLVSAVLERMGGYGKLIHLFSGDRPVRMALQYCGHIPEKSKSILKDYPLNRLNQISQQMKGECVAMETDKSRDSGIQRKDLQESTSSPDQTCAGEVEGGECDDEEGVSDVTEEEEDNNTCSDGSEEDLEPKEKKPKLRKCLSQEERELRKKERETRFLESQDELLKGGFDGLLVATRFLPQDIVLSLLPFLSPSRPFAIFCQFIEPLSQMYSSLKETGQVFDLHLSETWMRKYQVLSQRTHPLNQMSGTSGYILNGLTIISE